MSAIVWGSQLAASLLGSLAVLNLGLTIYTIQICVYIYIYTLNHTLDHYTSYIYIYVYCTSYIYITITLYNICIYTYYSTSCVCIYNHTYIYIYIYIYHVTWYTYVYMYICVYIYIHIHLPDLYPDRSHRIAITMAFSHSYRLQLQRASLHSLAFAGALFQQPQFLLGYQRDGNTETCESSGA